MKEETKKAMVELGLLNIIDTTSATLQLAKYMDKQQLFKLKGIYVAATMALLSKGTLQDSFIMEIDPEFYQEIFDHIESKMNDRLEKKKSELK